MCKYRNEFKVANVRDRLEYLRQSSMVTVKDRSLLGLSNFLKSVTDSQYPVIVIFLKLGNFATGT